MRLMNSSRDPGQYAVDFARKVVSVDSEDESFFGAREVQAGIRRAEEERCHVAALFLDHEQEDLPSENFFG